MAGKLVINPRYLIWAEREFDGGLEMALDVGRVIRLEGEDAETVWRSLRALAGHEDRPIRVVQGKPAHPPR
jgi:hypothetical protein